MANVFTRPKPSVTIRGTEYHKLQIIHQCWKKHQFPEAFLCSCIPVSVKRGKCAKRTQARRGRRWSPDKITPKEQKLCTKCPSITHRGPVSQPQLPGAKGPEGETTQASEEVLLLGEKEGERVLLWHRRKGEKVRFLRHTRASPSTTSSTHQTNSTSDWDVSSCTRKSAAEMLGKRKTGPHQRAAQNSLHPKPWSRRKLKQYSKLT